MDNIKNPNLLEILNDTKEKEKEQTEPEIKKTMSSFNSMLAMKLYEQRIIPIYYDIFEDLAEIVCAQLKAMATDSKKPITIELHTHGGGVFAGLAIFDEILITRQKGVEVNTIVKGLTASMGVVILQAGQTRSMTEHSRVMIHEISQLLVQSKRASEMKEHVVELNKLTSILTGILGKRMGMTKVQVSKLIKGSDIWYGPVEAKKVKLIDTIIKCPLKK
jgi:ATP-dependent Clp endopeptidase proteolytic subunit ClpP